jgi:hypothetical protein
MSKTRHDSDLQFFFLIYLFQAFVEKLCNLEV